MIFWKRLSLPPKNWRTKTNVTNVNLGSVKLKKREWGVCCEEIFVFTDAMRFPFVSFVTNTPLWEKRF